MDPLARVELDDRRRCGLFQFANVVCPHDGRCFRQNPQHFLNAAHPITAALPCCDDVLRLRPCSHLHRCGAGCSRPCPKRMALDAHNATFYHGPTARLLERVANGEPASKRVCLPVTTTATATTATTTITTTTMTTVTTAGPGPSKAPSRQHVGGKLSTDFVIPPFSSLNCNAGYWQARKREWFSLGLDGGAGRDDALLGAGLTSLTPGLTGTSIFDPVLCEVALNWYAPRPRVGGPTVIVIDPFAGGSTRGVVAAKLGFLYVGTDVGQGQVEANREQAEALCGDCTYQPRWVVCCGSRLGGGAGHRTGRAPAAPRHEGRLFVDVSPLRGVGGPFVSPSSLLSIILTPTLPSDQVYDNGPEDISGAATYADFLEAYERILASSTALLKHQHVAVVVVGNVREPDGTLLDLHGDTKRLLDKHDNKLYCDAVLQTALSSAPQRAGRQMRAASKLVSVHQNVVVTCKGAPLNTAACRAFGIQAAAE